MPVFVRVAMHDEFALVEDIENTADSLLIELLAPGEWERAETGSERAALPGFILLSSETANGPAAPRRSCRDDRPLVAGKDSRFDAMRRVQPDTRLIRCGGRVVLSRGG